jgi:hypothetical protein
LRMSMCLPPWITFGRLFPFPTRKL